MFLCLIHHNCGMPDAVAVSFLLVSIIAFLRLSLEGDLRKYFCEMLPERDVVL